MKPNKDTEYDEFVKWSENLCDKRHDKLVELRKKKVVNNPFKKWFYLGKKVKSTVYKVTGVTQPFKATTSIFLHNFFIKVLKVS